MFAYIAVFILLTVISISFYFRCKYRHWKRKGIQSFPVDIPFGNIRDVILLKKSYPVQFKELYDMIDGPYGGIYFGVSPVLFVKDPEIIKDILIKYFDHFQDRGVYFDEDREPLSAHLFRIEGPKWRQLRLKLSKPFSTGKLKLHSETIFKCGENLENALNDFKHGEKVDVSKVAQKFTTDVIAGVGFGFEANCLSDEQSIFNYFTNEVKHVNRLKKIIQQCILFVPEVMKFFRFRHQTIDSEKFFITTMEKTVKYREENSAFRDDYLQTLIGLKQEGFLADLNKHKTDVGKAVLNEIAAQSFVYFIAGLDTSNLTLSYALQLLAENPSVQEKVLTEIDAVLSKYNQTFSYECFREMEYLDKVIDETLRLRPPLSVLNRICNKPYKLPNTNITLAKGTKILISILDLHMDPKYFKDPEVFNPERFAKENKNELTSYTYLPFGDGPRSCIGARQGKLQTKVGLVSILRNNMVAVCEETVQPVTLPGAFLLTPERHIILKILKRHKMQ